MTPEELLVRRQRVYEELGVDFSSAEPVSLYSLLGISSDETDSKVISKAYRKQAKTLLSKKAKKDRPVVDAIQEEVEHAFGVLKDEARRERYDGFRTLCLAQARDARLKAAVAVACEDGRCLRDIYQRIRRFAVELGLPESEAESKVDALVEEAGAKVVDPEPVKAPEPPPPPPPDRLAEALVFCGLHGQISYEDFRRLMKLGRELGRTEAEVRKTIEQQARREGWELETEAPPKPKPTPSGRAPRPSSEERRARSDSDTFPRPQPGTGGGAGSDRLPRAGSGPVSTGSGPRPRPASERRPLRPDSAALKARDSGPRPVGLRPSGSQPAARVGPRPSGPRPAAVEAELPVAVHRLYESARDEVKQAILAHAELRSYVPPFNGDSAMTIERDGRGYEDLFLEEVECLRAACELLEDSLGKLGEHPARQAYQEHLKRVEDELREYLSQAEALDARLIAEVETRRQAALWRNYVESRRSARLIESLPEAMIPRSRRSTASGRRRRPDSGERPVSLPPDSGERVISLGRIPLGEGSEVEPPRAPRSRLRAPSRPPSGRPGARPPASRAGRAGPGRGPIPRPSTRGLGKRPGVSAGPTPSGSAPSRPSPPRIAPRPRPSSSRLKKPAVRRPPSGEFPIRPPSERLSPRTVAKVGRARRVYPIGPGGRRGVAGIALDSTASIATLTGDGHPRLIFNAVGEPETPTTVMFNKLSVLIGKTARDGRPQDPNLRIDDYLLRLGDESWRHRAWRRDYTAEALVALLLARLSRDAAAAGEPAITDVVLSAPSSLAPRQRAALFAAARMVDLNVLDVLDAPVASVLGLYEQDSSVFSDVTLVAHLGRQSLDVALFEAGPEGITAHSIGGDSRVGQAAWCEAVRADIEQQLVRRGLEPARDPHAPVALEVAAWRAFVELLAAESSTVEVEISGRREAVTIDAAAFDDLVGPLIDTSHDFVHEVIRTRLGGEAPDQVLLTGVPEMIPVMHDILAHDLGRKTRFLENPEPSAACGAALWGAWQMLAARRGEGGAPDDLRSDESFALTVPAPAVEALEAMAPRRTLEESIGLLLETPAGPRNEIIVPRGSILPARHESTLAVTGPGFAGGSVLPRQSGEVRITVLGGEDVDPRSCEALAELSIPDPNEIRSNLRVELRLMEHDGSFVIDVFDPVGRELLLSHEVQGEHRRGVPGEALVARWRRDLETLEDEGPAALEPL